MIYPLRRFRSDHAVLYLKINDRIRVRNLLVVQALLDGCEYCVTMYLKSC